MYESDSRRSAKVLLGTVIQDFWAASPAIGQKPGPQASGA